MSVRLPDAGKKRASPAPEELTTADVVQAMAKHSRGKSNILRDKLCLSGSREPVARGFRCRAPLLESVSGDREVLGSSFYKLPKVLQWFSGNIGFHHIHHLSSRIPNYNLDRCHRSDPVFEEVVHLTLRESFKTLTYTVWEEKARRLISFRKLKHQGNEPSVAD